MNKPNRASCLDSRFFDAKKPPLLGRLIFHFYRLDGDFVPLDEVSVFAPAMRAFLAAREGGVGLRAALAIGRRFRDDDLKSAPIQML